MRRQLRVASSALLALGSLVILSAVATAVGALAAGYRPVVIQTGSMGEAAPAGSLMIAAPRDGENVSTGNILVMRRLGVATVTHRVAEIEQAGSASFAITQGDANATPDPTPYPLVGEQLISRWVLPNWGRRLETIFRPGFALAVVGIALLVIAVGQLKRIWRKPDEDKYSPAKTATRAPSVTRRRRFLVLGSFPLLSLMTAGAAWAVFTNNELVVGNDFSTPPCFDPQLGSVQSGETIHAVDGVVSVPITPVSPTNSFLMMSVRSAGNEPVASTVRGHLTGGGTVVELSRGTDAGVPELLTVAWSVVEYPCGVTVQRGVLPGGGTNQLDIAITGVDPAASFVLVTSEAESTASVFDADDLQIPELTSPTNLRIRSDSAGVFDAQRQFAWQVVSFNDAADIDVQTVQTTLGVGITSDTLVLGSPADPSTTFLLSATTSPGSGPDIGERVVRTHLSSSNTVEVSRLVAGDPIEVQVQVVNLKDGSTVRHGTVDFNPGQSIRAVPIRPVDVTRSTAISTVATPGPSAGGSSDMIAGDVVGEASATFTILDPTTVTVTRDASSSAASFGWQVIEWAGPGWWDPDYTFRQRIDATATTTAAPDAYTLPLTVDHAALVTSGLSRADGSDMRIVRWDGTVWTELDRIIDPGSAWNQTTTTLWFRTVDPIATASTISYWLYFGNNTPGSPAADPENVFLLTENFDSGTLGDFEDRTGGTSWYTAAPWTRRIPITVPAALVSTNLTNFPLLVSTTQPDLAANAQPDGSDIRFLAADGVTELAHEIESWNSGSGRLVAWVKVPTVSSAVDTNIYLYYGASDAPDQQDARSTWPSDVEAVWHLARDPGGTAPQVDDSSPNNHDGLSLGDMSGTNLVPGLVGEAVMVDGIDDVLAVEDFELAGSTEITLSAWVKLDTFTNDARVITKASNIGGQIFELTVSNTGSVRFRLSLDGATAELDAGAGLVTLGSWHHVAATWDGATLRTFVDATEVGNMAASGLIDVGPTIPVTVGNIASADRGVDGVLDEVRVERIARSNAWLSAAEFNQRTPSAFAVVGTVQVGSWLVQGPWSFRKPIAIGNEQVIASVNDFSLLVQFVDPDLQAKATAGGTDIVFTDSDGATRLDHVIESWDNGTGALTAWVRLPILDAAATTEIFIYYGNASALDQQDPTGVFGPDADLSLLLGG